MTGPYYALGIEIFKGSKNTRIFINSESTGSPKGRTCSPVLIVMGVQIQKGVFRWEIRENYADI